MAGNREAVPEHSEHHFNVVNLPQSCWSVCEAAIELRLFQGVDGVRMSRRTLSGSFPVFPKCSWSFPARACFEHCRMLFVHYVT